MLDKLQNAATGALNAAKGMMGGNVNADTILALLPEAIRDQAKPFIEENLEKVTSGELDASVITSKLSDLGVSEDILSKVTPLLGSLKK